MASVSSPCSVGLGPAYTMGVKAKDRVDELPGPGDYDLDRDIRTGILSYLLLTSSTGL